MFYLCVFAEKALAQCNLAFVVLIFTCCHFNSYLSTFFIVNLNKSPLQVSTDDDLVLSLQDQWLWIDGSWFYNNTWSTEYPESSNPCLLLNSYGKKTHT